MSVRVSLRVTGSVEDPTHKDVLEHAVAAFWHALCEKVPGLEEARISEPRVQRTDIDGWSLLSGTSPATRIRHSEVVWEFGFHVEPPHAEPPREPHEGKSSKKTLRAGGRE